MAEVAGGADPRTELRPGAPAGSPAAARAPLRVAFSTPALRRCQLSAAAARVVDTATLVAVSTYLFGRAGAGAVAVFGVVRTLSPAIGTPVVLAAATGRAPGRVLAACAALTAFGSAATALLITGDGPLLAIHAMAALTATALCCVRPLVITLLPGLINRPAQLVATNAAAALVDGTSSLVGPLLAAAALLTLGGPAALWAAAALLAVVALLAAKLDSGPATDQPCSQRGRDVARDVARGMSTLAARGPVRLVVVLCVAQTWVRGALNVLVVVLAIDRLDLGAGGVGLLLGAIGVGSLLGLPLATRIAGTGRMARSLALALVLWGAPLVVVAVAPVPGLAIALFALIGLGNDLVDITADTLVQRLVPRGELPRVLGAFDATLYAGMAIGAVVAERLLDGPGLTTALVLAGLVLPALAALCWRDLNRLDARLRERDADVELLQLHGIFSPLVMTTVDHLTRRMAVEAYAPGAVIVRQHDVGDRFFLIEDGEVDVLDGDELLAVLGPGEGFGEMSLLDDRPRNATVVARSPVRVRALLRADFLPAVTSHEEAHEAARLLARTRVRSTTEVSRLELGPEPAG